MKGNWLFHSVKIHIESSSGRDEEQPILIGTRIFYLRTSVNLLCIATKLKSTLNQTIVYIAMLFKITNSNVQNLLSLYCVGSTTYLLFFRGAVNPHEVVQHQRRRRSLLSTDEEEFENELSVGTIVLWGGEISGIPSGWRLCDGNRNTPNLTDKFIIGAGNAFSMRSVGGRSHLALHTNQLPKHVHPLGNDSVIVEEADEEHIHDIRNTDTIVSSQKDHIHTVSTDNISMNGHHVHPVGTYRLNVSGEHTHYTHNGNTSSNNTVPPSNYIEADVSTITVASDTTKHTHSWSDTSSSAGIHTHGGTHNIVGLGIGSGGLWSGAGGLIEILGGATGAHTHKVAGTTASAGSHTHALKGSIIIDDFSLQASGIHDHVLKGNSGFSGIHNHTLFAESLPNGGHTHFVYGQTDWGSDNHSHEVILGETDSAGNGENINIMNPYYALAFIIKVSVNAETTSDGLLPQTTESLITAAQMGPNNTNYTMAIIFSVASLFVAVLLCFLYGFIQLRRRSQKVGNDDNHDIEEDRTNTELKEMKADVSVKDDECVQPDTLDEVFDGWANTDANAQSISLLQQRSNEGSPRHVADANDNDVLRTINSTYQ
eukprot:345638_1